MLYIEDIILNLFGIESSDNYLIYNEAYNKCSNILYNADVLKPVLEEKDRKFSISCFKKNVDNKSSIILEDVNLLVSYMRLDKFKKYKDNVSLLSKKKKQISVFDIPLKFGTRNITSYFSYGDLQSLPIIIESITLNRDDVRDDIITECKYIHEIGHALSQRKKKTLKNYLHFEFVPITLEFLYAYMNGGENVISEYVKCRITSFKNGLSPIPDTIDHMYNVSQLLAFQTIEKYIDFNNWQKKEMLSRLKDCLNCDIQVETFMEDYGIGFNDTESSVKSFRKTMERVGIK